MIHIQGLTLTASLTGSVAVISPFVQSYSTQEFPKFFHSSMVLIITRGSLAPSLVTLCQARFVRHCFSLIATFDSPDFSSIHRCTLAHTDWVQCQADCTVSHSPVPSFVCLHGSKPYPRSFYSTA